MLSLLRPSYRTCLLELTAMAVRRNIGLWLLLLTSVASVRPCRVDSCLNKLYRLLDIVDEEELEEACRSSESFWNCVAPQLTACGARTREFVNDLVTSMTRRPFNCPAPPDIARTPATLGSDEESHAQISSNGNQPAEEEDEVEDSEESLDRFEDHLSIQGGTHQQGDQVIPAASQHENKRLAGQGASQTAVAEQMVINQDGQTAQGDEIQLANEHVHQSASQVSSQSNRNGGILPSQNRGHPSISWTAIPSRNPPLNTNQTKSQGIVGKNSNNWDPVPIAGHNNGRPMPGILETTLSISNSSNQSANVGSQKPNLIISGDKSVNQGGSQIGGKEGRQDGTGSTFIQTGNQQDSQKTEAGQPISKTPDHLSGQSVKHHINQQISQPAARPIDQIPNKQVGHTVGQLPDQRIGHLDQPVNQQVGQLEGKPTTHSLDQPIVQSVDQLVSSHSDQTASQPADPSIHQPVHQILDQHNVQLNQSVELQVSHPVDQHIGQSDQLTIQQISLLAGQPAGHLPHQPVVQSSNQSDDKFIGHQPDQILGHPTDKPKGQPLGQLPDQIIGQLDQLVTQKISLLAGQPADHLPHQPVVQPSNQSDDKFIGHQPDQILGHPTDKAKGQPLGQLPDQIIGQLDQLVTQKISHQPSQPADQFPHQLVQSSNQSDDKFVGHQPDQILGHPTDKPKGEPLGQLPDQIIGQSDQPAIQQISHLAGHLLHQPVVQSSNQSDNKFAGHQTDQILGHPTDKPKGQLPDHSIGQLDQPVGQQVSQSIGQLPNHPIGLLDQTVTQQISKLMGYLPDQSVHLLLSRHSDQIVGHPTGQPLRVSVDKVQDQSVGQLDQPVNEQVDQIAGKPANDLADQLIVQSADQPINQMVLEDWPTGQSSDQVIFQSTGQQTKHVVGQSSNQSSGQSLDQSLNQSTSYSANQTKDHPIQPQVIQATKSPTNHLTSQQAIQLQGWQNGNVDDPQQQPNNHTAQPPVHATTLLGVLKSSALDTHIVGSETLTATPQTVTSIRSHLFHPQFQHLIGRENNKPIYTDAGATDSANKSKFSIFLLVVLISLASTFTV